MIIKGVTESASKAILQLTEAREQLFKLPTDNWSEDNYRDQFAVANAIKAAINEMVFILAQDNCVKIGLN